MIVCCWQSAHQLDLMVVVVVVVVVQGVVEEVAFVIGILLTGDCCWSHPKIEYCLKVVQGVHGVVEVVEDVEDVAFVIGILQMKEAAADCC